MYSQLMILGNLGNDPEMRYTDAGMQITNFSVASNHSFTSSSGERKKETTWYRVSTFGKLAEVCNEYLKKGRSVLILGRLRPDSETGGPTIWKKSDGTHSASFDVAAQSVQFIGGPDERTQAGPGRSTGSDDFDIPF